MLDVQRMKFQALALFIVIAITGCYHTKNFEGKAVKISTEDYGAKLEPVRIGVGESIPRKIGYDNGNLNATGMRLLFFSSNKEVKLNYSELEGYYRFNGSEKKPLDIPYSSPYGPEPQYGFRAYLVPTADIEPPKKEYDFATIETQAIPEGRYQITILFKEGSIERELDFDFTYDGRTYYQAPDFNVSGK